MEEVLHYEEAPHWWSDQRAELMLGALACAVLALVVAMLAFVFVQAWPSFAHNGLHWFGAGGSVDEQIRNISLSGDLAGKSVYTSTPGRCCGARSSSPARR